MVILVAVPLAIAALLGSDLRLIAASNRDPRLGERGLVSAAGTPRCGPVFTDPGTATGTAWMLAVHHLGRPVRVPGVGDVYCFDHPRRGIPADWPIQAPRPGWIAVRRFVKPPTPVARLLRGLGLPRFLPGVLAHKLLSPPSDRGALSGADAGLAAVRSTRVTDGICIDRISR